MFNNNLVPVTVTISVAELGNLAPAVPLGSMTITSQPFTGFDAELVSALGLPILADTYGIVKVETSIDNALTEMLRLKNLNGFIDIATSIPVR